MSLQSRRSANDKDDEMISRSVHKSPGIYLTAEENPGQSELGEISHRFKWDPLLPNEVGRIAPHVRK